MERVSYVVQFVSTKAAYGVAHLVLGIHMDNAVGVNIKGDLNLGHASRGRWDANQLKLAQLLVVSCHLTLTLEHLDAHLRLVVSSCAESLGLLCGDGCIPAAMF